MLDRVKSDGWWWSRGGWRCGRVVGSFRTANIPRDRRNLISHPDCTLPVDPCTAPPAHATEVYTQVALALIVGCKVIIPWPINTAVPPHTRCHCIRRATRQKLGPVWRWRPPIRWNTRKPHKNTLPRAHYYYHIFTDKIQKRIRCDVTARVCYTIADSLSFRTNERYYNVCLTIWQRNI